MEILRKAINHSKSSSDFEGALKQVSTARNLNPDFWEVDRVEGFLRSNMGDLAGATRCYKRAYELAQGNDRAVVAHFFAGHLSRKIRDVSAAITLAEEAHSCLQLAETAVALGNYLAWANRFPESIALIEPAIPQQKGTAHLIAVTSLTDAYNRWSVYGRDEEKNFLHAYGRAKKGAEIGLAALGTGISDDKLRDTGCVCCVESLQCAARCIRLSITVPQLSDWLDSLTGQIVRLASSWRWRSLLSAVEALERSPRPLVAARRLADVARSIDSQMVGATVSAEAASEKA